MISTPAAKEEVNKTTQGTNTQEPRVEAKIQGTKEVSADSNQDPDQTFTVEFTDENYAKNITQKQTKVAEEIPRIDSNTPADKVKADNEKYEVQKNQKLTFGHYREIAGTIIHIMDVGASSALNFIARDTARQAYAMHKSDKDALIEQLAIILCKYQSKFSSEFAFLLLLLAIYTGPAMAAFRRRKENLAEENKSDTKKQNEKAWERHEPMSKTAAEVTKEIKNEVKTAKEEITGSPAEVIESLGKGASITKTERPPISKDPNIRSGKRRQGKQSKVS